jgi:lysophospholipase L1-like esterase
MNLALALVVLPLGDSITEGVPTVDGYRAPLAAMMAKAGVQLRYVGSQRSPAGAHEGWAGFTTAELIPVTRAALARHRPDVVLLHIGTNDLGMGVSVEEAAANVRALLLLIDERSRAGGPNGRLIQVLLAKIIARDLFGDGRDPLVDQYNGLLAGVAAERSKAGQPVVLVDIHHRVDPRRDLADALHPSESGYAKIAAGWAEALKSAVRKRSPP